MINHSFKSKFTKWEFTKWFIGEFKIYLYVIIFIGLSVHFNEFLIQSFTQVCDYKFFLLCSLKIMLGPFHLNSIFTEVHGYYQRTKYRFLSEVRWGLGHLYYFKALRTFWELLLGPFEASLKAAARAKLPTCPPLLMGPVKYSITNVVYTFASQ